MKERLGGFGDVVFALLLTGIVAAFVALVAQIVSALPRHHAPADILALIWTEYAPILQFFVISILWLLQARIVTRLYVDHIGFIAVYMAMLYFLFGWVLVEGIIPELMQQIGGRISPMTLFIGPTALICMAFAMLFVLAIGGLTYHWIDLRLFQRYESARDACMIGCAALITGFASGNASRLHSPFDFLVLLAVFISIRAILAISVDVWALEQWGTRQEKGHHARVVLAGLVLLLLAATSYLVLIGLDPLTRHIIGFWLFGGAALFGLVFLLRKQLTTVKTF